MRTTMLGTNHFTVTVQRAFDRTDTDATFTMAAHTLTLTPDGHLSIEGQYQSRAFSSGAWDRFEVKRLAGTGG